MPHAVSSRMSCNEESVRVSAELENCISQLKSSNESVTRTLGWAERALRDIDLGDSDELSDDEDQLHLCRRHHAHRLYTDTDRVCSLLSSSQTASRSRSNCTVTGYKPNKPGNRGYSAETVNGRNSAMISDLFIVNIMLV